METRLIKWSYSALKDFTTCPRQYAEVRVKQNFRKEDNVYASTGRAIHTALEQYVRDGIRLPDEYKSYEKYVRPLLTELTGDYRVEQKLALRHDKVPVPFDSDERWVRGIIDLLVLDHHDNTAYIVDYKTGSNKYADLRQLKLMACLVFHHYDHIQRCRVGLLFLNKNDFITDEYSKDNLSQLWASFAADLFRLNLAYETDHWMPNPSGLCKNFCPVTSCEFHGKRGR